MLKEPQVSIDLNKVHPFSREYYLNLLKKEKDTYVQRSGIAGMGLYAAEPIMAGDVVTEYGGRREEPGVVHSRSGSSAMSQYIMDSAEGTVSIDGAIGQWNAKYANHSCNPNCEYVTEKLTDSDGNLMEVVFMFSLRPISMFEEITVDYAWNIEKKDEVVVCHCGSKNCDGYVGKFNFLVARKKPVKEEGSE